MENWIVPRGYSDSGGKGEEGDVIILDIEDPPPSEATSDMAEENWTLVDGASTYLNLCSEFQHVKVVFNVFSVCFLSHMICLAESLLIQPSTLLKLWAFGPNMPYLHPSPALHPCFLDWALIWALTWAYPKCTLGLLNTPLIAFILVVFCHLISLNFCCILFYDNNSC